MENINTISKRHPYNFLFCLLKTFGGGNCFINIVKFYTLLGDKIMIDIYPCVLSIYLR